MHANVNLAEQAPWWDYIRSQIIRKIQDQLQDPAIEKCFKFIEDGDLWRWRLSGAKAFYAGLKARDIEYDATKNPNVFQELLKLQPEALIAEVWSCTVGKLEFVMSHSDRASAIGRTDS